MADDYPQQESFDVVAKTRNLEEQQRLVKDRVLLLGNTLVEERGKSFKEIQEMKSTLIKTKEEVQRLKELVQRLAEQLAQTARKEELAILQRQFDLFRKE